VRRGPARIKGENPVNPIERILCPMDPEWPAHAALCYSLALAERFRASLDVVHAFPARSTRAESNDPKPDRAAGELRLRERLEQAISTLSAASPGRTTLRVIQGQPLTALLSHSRRTGCDLVVVGSERPRQGVLALAPSIGEAVAHHADCAVLSLRETDASSSPPSIGRVLLAIDFSDTTELAIDWAAAVVRRFGARLQLLHVRSTSSYRRLGLAGLERDARGLAAKLNEIEVRLARLGISVELTALSDGCVADRVVEQASSGGCDLIVLGAHARTGAFQAAIQGVVADVRRRSQVPVLSVRKARPEVLFASPGFDDSSEYTWERACGAGAARSASPTHASRTGG
jgi:nucleotide-binding universal stress UspA family protein